MVDHDGSWPIVASAEFGDECDTVVLLQTL